LATNTTLIFLALRYRALGAVDARELAGMLERNKTLRVLHLDGNTDFRDDAARLLATALERNPSLKEFRLGDGTIGDDGASHLAAALERNTTLELLYLDGNNIGARGARHLAAALERNSTLTSLSLVNNRIGEQLLFGPLCKPTVPLISFGVWLELATSCSAIVGSGPHANERWHS
jgi:Ran GTPase-activating protein (RanGAP) involved in mRNA processing and transport